MFPHVSLGYHSKCDISPTKEGLASFHLDESLQSVGKVCRVAFVNVKRCISCSFINIDTSVPTTKHRFIASTATFRSEHATHKKQFSIPTQTTYILMNHVLSNQFNRKLCSKCYSQKWPRNPWFTFQMVIRTEFHIEEKLNPRTLPKNPQSHN